MLQAPFNDFILKIDRKFNDEIQFKSGVKLHIATNFDPGEHANVIGEVVSVPRAIDKRPDYNGMSDEGVEPGDKLIVRYDLVYAYSSQPDRDTNRHRFEMIYKGESFWRCNIHKAFAAIKPDGTIVMLNGYVMLFPYFITKTLFIPGHLKAYQRAIASPVMHIDKPLKGQPKLPVKNGHIVYFDPRIAQNYKARNKEYVIVKQSHLMGYSEQ